MEQLLNQLEQAYGKHPAGREALRQFALDNMVDAQASGQPREWLIREYVDELRRLFLTTPRAPLVAILPDVFGHSFNQIDGGRFAAFAVSLWYDRDDPTPTLQAAVLSLAEVERRQAVYLVDLLRRNACMADERYEQLTAFALGWSELKPAEIDPALRQLAERYQLSQVAMEWGLCDDASHLLQYSLPYQKRIFSEPARRQ